MCRICKKLHKREIGYFSCDCDYNVCPSCRPIAHPSLIIPFGECPKQGHLLEWKAEAGENYTCDRCKRQKPCGPGRWTCSSGCDYNLCEECRPKNRNAVLDPTGNPMDFTTSTKSGPTYLCANCHRTLPSKNGRWHSDQDPSQDLCPECKQPLGALCIQPISSCKNGHFFTWSEDSKGYPGEKYTCDACHRASPCKEGRWTCICKTNICPICKPGMDKYSRCKANHELRWSTNNNNYKADTYNCGLCKTPGKCSEGRWNCEPCSYDICMKCCPSVPIKAAIRYLECPQEHPLKYKEDIDGKFDCMTCQRKNIDCKNGRWTCEPCQYSVCLACRPTKQFNPEAKIEAVPKANKIQCPKGHLLIYTKSDTGYPDKLYKCHLCDKKEPCAKGRWSCIGCKYDICTQCRSFDYSTFVLSAFAQCPMGHSLDWSRKDQGYPNSQFECAICESQKNSCLGGRWSCERCRYDVCNLCEPPHQGDVYDKRKHLMKWSTNNAGGKDGKFTCVKCKAEMPCQNGRWCCEICPENLCNKCRPPVGPLIFSQSQPVDKKGHTLMWTDCATGYKDSTYKCAICGKVDRNAKMRWSCTHCQYDICPSCQPSQSSYRQCKDNHPVLWDTKKYYEPITCATCKSQNNMEDGRWSCENCRYFVCTKCRPPISPELIRPYVECKSGHLLYWSNNDEKNPDKTYNCATCARQKIPCSTWRWNCQNCKYDVCPACRPIEEISLDEENEFFPRTKLIQCHKGHLLTRGVGGPRDSKFKCEICSVYGPRSNDRWRCMNCDYNVCLNCRPPLMIVQISSLITQCPKGHPLRWGNNAIGYDKGQFKCNFCQKQEPCMKNRYNCPQCHYDLCPECRPLNNSGIHDPKGHDLVWTTYSDGYTAKKYGCKKCKDVGRCIDGRWSCPPCFFDLCPTCYPAKGAVIIPSKTEDPSGNLLQYSTDSMGYKNGQYVCAECGKKEDCQKGRYTSPETKYNLCPECKRKPEELMMCSKMHKLNWSSNGDLRDEGVIQCKCCKEETDARHGYWTCEECKNYDICRQCRPPVDPFVIKPYTQCPKSHLLKWSKEEEGYPTKQYACAICKRPGSCVDGRWCCKPCKYDICQFCRTMDEEGKKEQEERKDDSISFDLEESLEEKGGRKLYRIKAEDKQEMEPVSIPKEEKKAEGKKIDEVKKGSSKLDEKKQESILPGKSKEKPNKEESKFISTKEEVKPVGILREQPKKEEKKVEDKKQEGKLHEIKKDQPKKEAKKVEDKPHEIKKEQPKKEDKKVEDKPHEIKKEQPKKEDKKVEEKPHEIKKEQPKKEAKKVEDKPHEIKKEQPKKEDKKVEEKQHEIKKEKPKKEDKSIKDKKLEEKKQEPKSHEIKKEQPKDHDKNLEEKKQQEPIEIQKEEPKTEEKKQDLKPHEIDKEKQQLEDERIKGALPEEKKKQEHKPQEIKKEPTKPEDSKPFKGEKEGKTSEAKKDTSKPIESQKEERKPGDIDPNLIMLDEEEIVKEQARMSEVKKQQARKEDDKKTNMLKDIINPDEKVQDILTEKRIIDQPEEKSKVTVPVQKEEDKEKISPEAQEENKDDEDSSHSPGSSSSRDILTKGLLKMIKKVTQSKQHEEVKEHIQQKTKGKVTWNKTHFIFIIDCSGSMKGTRWNSVVAGYKKCLTELSKMEDIIITTFTFDDKVNKHIAEKNPAKALKRVPKIPFTGKGTNYPEALNYAVNCINNLKVEYRDYLTCMLFLSDGQGGYPSESILQLKSMRESGRKILFYTIACVTEEDEDMRKMMDEMKGDHYQVSDPRASQQVFKTILKVQSN